ncbi:MAG TPA: long-chain fatty acid--CoA ligase [Aurantimonas coralicida]|uniref:3-methylmercaptopropionyl-CoA ligase n=2 Tax=root TaxID=1 RepID=A0A9C9TID0_9HYPH|nr:long-chain fatty acid--CoA ligase [Aurantimonas coralicida]HEU02237.1 long-chain fatty acid--CoA ligase [Aurantimonas coralicida]
MNLAIWLHQTARIRPDAPAIRLGETLHTTYDGFARRSAALAGHLTTRHGIERGDRVALFAKNCPEYLELLYAVLWLGAVVVPINNKLHAREAAWIIGNAGAKLAITETGAILTDTLTPEWGVREIGIGDPEFAEVIERAQPTDYRPPVPADDNDVAWLFYTSGTTGRPKGVMTTHMMLRMMSTSFALDVDTASAGDHSLYAAPMSHGAGLYNFPFVRAGACHVIPRSKSFDPDEIRELGEKLGNLVFFAAPTMVKRLVVHARQTGYRGAGIRSIIYGGGPMYLADIDEALSVFGPKFVQIYGQGESPMTITVLPRDLVADDSHPEAKARRVSVGYPQSCVEVRVVDEAMTECPVGEVGEVVVRGDTVMPGYWQDEAATRSTLVDGWLKTGDLGRLDANGFLTLTDRSKDVIISGGTNIYPREVEEALLAHEAIFEVSVIGCPDPEWGEEVVAFVVATDGASLGKAELDAWCKASIASFKKPRRYVFVEDLPKNSYGKILKTNLRRMAEARGEADA